MRIQHGVNEDPSFIPTCFGTQQKRGESGKNFILLYFHVDINRILSKSKNPSELVLM